MVVQDVVLGTALADYVAALRSRPLVVVVLAARADVVAAREAARAKDAYGDAGGVAALDAHLRRATPRIGLWLDTSGQAPAETVDEIVRRGLEPGQVP